MNNIVRLFPISTGIIEKSISVDVPRETQEFVMDVKAFREQIVRPALKIVGLGLWSQAAENLLVGTALTESRLDTMMQTGGGPGLSYYQIEPATYLDICRYLSLPNNKQLKTNILSSLLMDVLPAEASSLVWNLRLATLIARIKYYMRPEPLPAANEPILLYKYYKDWYNSSLGKATEQRCLVDFTIACK